MKEQDNSLSESCDLNFRGLFRVTGDHLVDEEVGPLDRFTCTTCSPIDPVQDDQDSPYDVSGNRDFPELSREPL